MLIHVAWSFYILNIKYSLMISSGNPKRRVFTDVSWYIVTYNVVLWYVSIILQKISIT